MKITLKNGKPACDCLGFARNGNCKHVHSYRYNTALEHAAEMMRQAEGCVLLPGLFYEMDAS